MRPRSSELPVVSGLRMGRRLRLRLRRRLRLRLRLRDRLLEACLGERHHAHRWAGGRAGGDQILL